MPGQLGYTTTRNITLFSHIDNKTASEKLSDIEPGANKTFHFEVQREMTDLDYAHIRSVVDYKERFAFGLKNESHLDEEVTVYNHGALSTWHQLNHRPDFVKAFKAITELKNRLRKSDMFGRYLALNAYELNFNDYSQLKDSVFYNIAEADAQKLFNDPTYGMGVSKYNLYKWVYAMNSTSDSGSWKDI